MKSCVETLGARLSAAGEPAVLVGHSFGGAVVSRACELYPGSVRLAVYLCAFLLRDGQSVWRHGVPSPRTFAADAGVLTRANLQVDEANSTVDLNRSVIEDAFYEGCSPQVRQHAMARWRVEPMEPLRTPLSLTEANYGRVPRIYIHSRNDRVIPPASQERMCRLAGCKKEIGGDWGHSPFLSHPEALAGLLMDLGSAGYR